MEVRFSERANGLKASEIRELLKLAEMPEIISFAGGLPAPELFPVKEMEEIIQKVLEKDGRLALQYGSTEGIKPLREIIAKQRMAPAGVNVTADEVAITSGSQQGLEFSARVFINEGDKIICESPSYLGAINAFKAYQPQFIEIPMDDNGMKVDLLEEALKANPDVKMIYTIPDFQNPTGRTMSDDRRKRIAELAAEYQIPVIEDNPYGDLIFDGERHPSIKSFDKEGWVIYLGTFSKTFCPGLRIGWVCAAPQILEKYIIVKQGADLQSSSLDQRATALFMETYDLEKHIESIRGVYGKRRDLMIESIKQYFPADVKYTFPTGGLFTWIELKEGLDAAVILQEALKDNVAYVPGGSFFPNGGHPNFFRMNYSCMTEEKIVEGIKRLGKVLAKFY
ncbi:PLP-dependent aminotransferase family protein [Clostridium sp. CX1]|uniref:PLP-dependent aminotransferase family protein n=1 Tax=Clostridium tanneri TaxID=3037988 RepID=A0ABU4JVI1_9CLOT|nr:MULTISPECIES: PLP-dependent aminotransferase family protein [unclassified Clostridium]MCT8975538.1 PLP-dependent aminotransferase family protein [Clostridium sp. CX1]MDW8801938.1 PLP-dependent aminotransferase family protein [Clostridium sp. A1-XYC3]